MTSLDPIDLLFARAKAASVTMTDICAKAGVAPSTPSRWKKAPDSATLGKIRELEEALVRIIEARKAGA